jgi:signal peptide peptidase SppA
MTTQVGSMPFSLNSIWAMEPMAFEQLRELVAGSSHERLVAAASTSAADSAGSGYEVRDGVAVMPFSGLVTKNRTLMGRIFGGQAVTSEAMATFAAAEADTTVKSILMVIDSPGGTVDGTADFADAVACATKPVTAYAQDLAASAAYWIGSQADRFVGNSTTKVGSIGVLSVVPDISRLAKNMGIDVNVVKSASAKGAGTMGAPVTDSQLAEVQRLVDATHSLFVSAVSRGRKKDMSAVADGRVHVGQDAVKLGLLDAIEPLSTTLAAMQEAAKPKPEPMMIQETLMAETQTLELKIDATQLKTLTDTIATVAKAQAEQAVELSAIKASKDIDALIAQGRTDRKIRGGTEKGSTEHTVRATAAHSIPAARELVESLKAEGPAGGSVVDPATRHVGSAAALPPRHRFDAYGPQVWAKSSDPKMHEYGAQIEWIAAYEAAGNPKFKNVTEAMQAFHAANFNQERTA